MKRRGRVCTSETGALPAPSAAADYKTPLLDGLLPKTSESLQSAKKPCPFTASRPPTKPIGATAAVRTGRIYLFYFHFCDAQIEKTLLTLSFQINSPEIWKLIHANMKHQLLVVLLCVSCGASALGTSIHAVSTLNFTDLGAAHGYGTDTTTKIRKRRYISQNDMLAILDYHNKVRGRVFPPASNMEYMVSESFNHLFQPQLLVYLLVWMERAQWYNWCTDCPATDNQSSYVRKEEEVLCICHLICFCRHE